MSIRPIPLLALPFLSLILLSQQRLLAAVFPAPPATAARLEIADSQGLLSWNPTGVTPAPNALTVMFWAKIVIPDVTTFQLTEDMTLVGNRRTSDWNQNHSYRFYFSATTGNIQFSAKGSSGALPVVTLIERPYLDRWYHIAAVRIGSQWQFYVDGRAVQLSVSLPDIGNTNTTDGVSIGGFQTGQKFYGEIQEFAVFQRALNAGNITTNRLNDISPSYPGLRGYYKFGYSPTATENLKNFSAAPPAPLVAVPDATKQGSGTVDFPETDKQGEQSLFDSQKNQGRDAQSPLAGGFTWQRTAISRPTVGVPFEFRLGYNSGISFNSQALESGANMFSNDAVLGPGWRHSFQTRIIPGSQFLNPQAGGGFLGLLLWDGSLETWQRMPGTRNYKTLHGEYRGELQETPDGDAIVWITPERLIYRFYHPANEIDPNLTGKLQQIGDFNGNKVVLAYEPNQGLLDTVTDTAGTDWKFKYNAQTLLESVEALDWKISFTFDGSSRLQTFSHRGPAAYEATPPLGTTWTFAYGGPNGLLDNVTSPRNITDVHVSYDKYGRKTSEVDGGNRTTGYTYLSPGPRQVTQTDGDGKKWIQTFDRKGHVTASTDPLGNTMRYEFYAMGDKDDFNNNIPVAGVLKRQIEPLGWVTKFNAYDERGNLLQKTDALGNAWKWTYVKPTDPAGANGKLTETIPPGSIATPIAALLNRPLTDTRPRVTDETADWTNRYLYDSRGNLLQHADDIGTLAEYAYYPNGLVWTAKDANYTASNRSITTNSYFPDTGFLHTRTDPAGNGTTFDFTELGWPKAVKNALQQTVTREFNVNGQTVRTTDGMGFVTTATFDEVGNQRFAKDAKSQQSETQYDGSNLATWTKDRANSVSTIGYNNRSLPETFTSPAVLVSQASGPPLSQSLVSRRSYDDAGRLLRETDPADGYIEHSYDANGNETATRDRNGKFWRKQYDRLNRPLVSIDPEGNTNISTYDQAGRLSIVTNANGNTTRHQYDGRGRLKKWTDPQGADWIYGYDGVGNITDIEDALHGHYKMEYDVRGLRKREENQDHLVWQYTYDELGRLKSRSEPTHMSRTLFYDNAGRLLVVQHSSGRSDVMGPDPNGNVLFAYRLGTDSQLVTTFMNYDTLDRPITSTDMFGIAVGYDYDALGRVSKITYPGNRPLSQEFDKLGRLVRQSTSAAWGGHVLSYEWDQEGRLRKQTYPNGMIRSANYDDSGRQTLLSYTDGKGTADETDDTVQIALGYAYDNNGNQTSAQEKGLLAYQPPAAHDETSDYTAAGRIESRTDAAVPDGSKNWTYDFKNADNTQSFNLSKATNPTVGTLALAYDEDNRTTSLELTTPQSQVSRIQNRYDALGRRISRTVTAAGVATESRFVLNLVGGMERILADATSSGEITALYLHGPDLAVKIDPANPANITCFHSDASGNIVRLTDKDRAPLAEYAYSDYGRPLAATATAGFTDNNPYRFVGSQGVMEEGLIPGLTFMRARYYLADAGVFLSVDPVKNIGPGWKPEAYGYGDANPINSNDPTGLMTDAQAERIQHLITRQQAESDAIYAQLDSDLWNIQADYLESVNTSLEVLENLYSSDLKGAGLELINLTGEGFKSWGYKSAGSALMITGKVAGIVKGAVGLKKLAGNVGYVTDDIKKYGGSPSRIMNLSATGWKGSHYENVITSGKSLVTSTIGTLYSASNSSGGSFASAGASGTSSGLSGTSTNRISFSMALTASQTVAAVNRGNAITTGQIQTAISSGALRPVSGSPSTSTAPIPRSSGGIITSAFGKISSFISSFFKR